MSSRTGNVARDTRTRAEVETGRPPDVHRGFIAPAPGDADEAAADRAMAEAERAVVEGRASAGQREIVEAMGRLRTHEERRALFMGKRG